MDQKVFRKKIKQELRKLNKKQAVHFAWLCAVRALPFLGSKGNFSFWNKKDRQKHIYAIFYALDAYAAYAAYAAATADAAYAAYAAAADAADAADAAADAATAAAYAYIDDATTAVYAYIAAAKNNIDLESIIFQDLKNIQKSEKDSQYNYTELYGAIWDNFQKALEDEGCAYWGLLYKRIFDEGFVLDQEELKRRMHVPEEIRAQGAAAVASFLEALEKEGAKRLNEARIIILGEKGAGKTCLARRLIDPGAPMTTDNESTAGVDTTPWKLEKENINIRIWDFAGHTVTHAVHQFFLSERCLYIMVYDGRTEERNRLEYWLDHMKNYGGNNSKAIILVNKRDQHGVDIPINILKEQYSIEGLYTFSIRDDKAELEDFRNTVAKYIKNYPSWNNLEIPANYYQVKKELEELFVKREKGKGNELITREEFSQIAQKYHVDKEEALLKNLHALGVSLWYKDMEKYNTLVLNPEWISHGVYKIINWVHNQKKYALSLSDFALVFNGDEDRYPKDKHEFIFRLMIHYELAYNIKGGDCLIIPHLLKEDRPDKLPDFPVGDSLMLRYKAEQPLPPHTISRFIVRHNQEIKKEGSNALVWRTGVVLDDGNGNLALVREDDRSISVSVKGIGRTSYLSVLRETLNDIFNSYKSKKPELQYRVERFGQIPGEEKNPLWLADRNIITHAIDNIPYYDVNTGRFINLQYTANQYNITAQNLISGQGNQLIDQSVRNTFDFHDCNIGLQGNLNELARLLTQAGHGEDARELKSIAEALEATEKCETKDDVKKKGITSSLKHLAEDLGDDNSKLHKTIKGIKNGISIAQDIAKGYNDVAQWLGLPQVPKPFLK